MTRLVLLALAAQSAACTGGDARQAADPGEPLSVRWSREFNTDASYADIQEVLVWNGRVLLLEPGNATVRALDAASGDSLWTMGRHGAAAGEFAYPDELVDLGSDRFGVLDARQGRLTEVGAGGAVVAIRTGEALAADLNSLCLDRTQGKLAVRYPGMEVVRLDARGPAVVVDSLRWPEATYNEAPVLRQGRFARSHEGRCVLWQVKGPYFSVLSGEGRQIFRRYVTPYPAVTIDRSGPVPTARTAPGAASSAALLGDTLFVLRGSVTRQDHGIVDVYELSGGRWIRSLVVAAATVGIDVAPGVLVALTSEDDGTGVIAYGR